MLGDGTHELLRFKGSPDLYVRSGHVFSLLFKDGWLIPNKLVRLVNHTLGESWRIR